MSVADIGCGPSEATTLIETEQPLVRAGERPQQADLQIGWNHYATPVYRLEVRVLQEDCGVSVHVPALPGVASQGEADTDALDNIREALAAAIESYVERGEAIPWVRECVDLAPGERPIWVVMRA